MSLEVGLEVAVVLEYLQFGKLDRARRTLEPLLAEHAQNPEVLRAQSRLAWAEGNEASAIEHLRAAVSQQLENTTWASELATLYVQTSRWHEAEQLLSDLMQSEPNEPAHVMNLAVVLLSSARTAEAMALVDRAQTLGADFKAVAINRASILRNWGQAREAANLLRQVIEANPNDIAVKARLSGTVLYDSEETPETVREAMVDLGRYLERTVPKIYRKASGDPEKRLRIGYVSPDLRAHSVAAFLEPLLKHHDRSRVEVFGIMCNATEDAVTERLKALCDGWVNASKLSDDALCAWIREAGIDVLVDLAGYTEGTRIQIFASRPVPVQVSYLGFPATTGI